MSRAIGVVITSRIAAGLIENHRLIPPTLHYPEDPDSEALLDLPVENLCHEISLLIATLREKRGQAAAGRAQEKPPDGSEAPEVEAVGIAVPGIIRGGTVEDSPNLVQLKGARIAEMISTELAQRQIHTRVLLLNDADATAAGLAARNGQLDRVVRVWTLGNGIGYGRYPYRPGMWEGGHTIVTLDAKETYCGCGGLGHLEGIMGLRAMRLRFMDMEPEEVFAAARTGDARCRDFVDLWHRALAAATATSIHLDGPGHFYLTGPNLRFLDLRLLKEYLWQMVKMSPLQNYVLHAVPEEDEIAVEGAAAGALLRGTQASQDSTIDQHGGHFSRAG